MKRLALALAVAASAAFIVASGPAHAANNYPVEWFDEIDDNVIYNVRDTIKIQHCWDTSQPTKLQARKDGKWVTLAKSRVTRSTKKCPQSTPYRHLYKWLITRGAVTNDEVKFRITDGEGTKSRNYIDISGSPTQTAPATPPQPTVPVPTPAPVWSATDSLTWSAQEVEFVRYLRAALETRPPSVQLYLCRSLADPTDDGANRMFYDEAAEQAVTLYGIEWSKARQIAPQFYWNICDAKFSLPTRIL